MNVDSRNWFDRPRHDVKVGGGDRRRSKRRGGSKLNSSDNFKCRSQTSNSDTN